MPTVPTRTQNAFPGQDAYAVAPSDGAPSGAFRALYVGVTGDVTIMTLAGVSVLFRNVATGILPVSGQGVKATGTSASAIVALT